MIITELAGHDVKIYPSAAIDRADLNIRCMNSRRQRTGIDLRLYRVDPQFWQCQLLAPTHFTASGFAHY